jgi:isocitrate/isopropylmalate dehydrogenase
MTGSAAVTKPSDSRSAWNRAPKRVQLRKELDLYASLVHCFNLPGLKTRHDNVNIVVIRENTEGEYSGLEHEVVPGVVESLKVFYTVYLLNCPFYFPHHRE